MISILSPTFKTILDENANEFVLFHDCYSFNEVTGVLDKTEFEAIQNHIHILDSVKDYELNMLIPIANKLGMVLLENLKYHYPQKKFVVYVTIRLHDSMIIRFHQQWPNELDYFDANDFTSSNEKIFIFK
jgi:hypothetical protein